MTSPAGKPWRLFLAATSESAPPLLAAELHVTGSDWPWLQARVVRHPAFEQVAELFVEELKLATDDTDDTDAWEAVYKEIRARTRLQDPEGADVPEYLLHIDGPEAWWRFHDAPFEDSG